MQETLETLVWSLGQENPLEKRMATHSSILAWRMPRTEKPGGLQSTGLWRVGHDWATFPSLLHFKYICVCVCVKWSSVKWSGALLNYSEQHTIKHSGGLRWRSRLPEAPFITPRLSALSLCAPWCTLSLRRPSTTGRCSINEAEWANEVDAGKQNFILMPYSAYLTGSDDPQFQHYQNQQILTLIHFKKM